MEEGNLHQFVTLHRPQLGMIVAIGMDVAHGLFDLHREGIIHRDVKPENILLCRDGEGEIHAKLAGSPPVLDCLLSHPGTCSELIPSFQISIFLDSIPTMEP